MEFQKLDKLARELNFKKYDSRRHGELSATPPVDGINYVNSNGYVLTLDKKDIMKDNKKEINLLGHVWLCKKGKGLVTCLSHMNRDYEQLKEELEKCLK
ncbi:MAG: hypothetical protein ACE5J4_03105 [Candidatus Aenigmatarchaeota archaeon]